jgi:hypothetical protein
MRIAEKLPSMTDKDLASLRTNAQRLGQSGTPQQQQEATRLLPLIDAELDGRKARTPPLQRLRRMKKA